MGLAVAFKEHIHLSAEFLIPFANTIQVGARLLGRKFHCFRKDSFYLSPTGFFHRGQTKRKRRACSGV